MSHKSAATKQGSGLTEGAGLAGARCQIQKINKDVTDAQIALSDLFLEQLAQKWDAEHLKPGPDEHKIAVSGKSKPTIRKKPKKKSKGPSKPSSEKVMADWISASQTSQYLNGSRGGVSTMDDVTDIARMTVSSSRVHPVGGKSIASDAKNISNASQKTGVDTLLSQVRGVKLLDAAGRTVLMRTSSRAHSVKLIDEDSQTIDGGRFPAGVRGAKFLDERGETLDMVMSPLTHGFELLDADEKSLRKVLPPCGVNLLDDYGRTIETVTSSHARSVKLIDQDGQTVDGYRFPERVRGAKFLNEDGKTLDMVLSPLTRGVELFDADRKAALDALPACGVKLLDDHGRTVETVTSSHAHSVKLINEDGQTVDGRITPERVRGAKLLDKKGKIIDMVFSPLARGFKMIDAERKTVTFTGDVMQRLIHDDEILLSPRISGKQDQDAFKLANKDVTTAKITANPTRHRFKLTDDSRKSINKTTSLSARQAKLIDASTKSVDTSSTAPPSGVKLTDDDGKTVTVVTSSLASGVKPIDKDGNTFISENDRDSATRKTVKSASTTWITDELESRGRRRKFTATRAKRQPRESSPPGPVPARSASEMLNRPDLHFRPQPVPLLGGAQSTAPLTSAGLPPVLSSTTVLGGVYNPWSPPGQNLSCLPPNSLPCNGPCSLPCWSPCVAPAMPSNVTAHYLPLSPPSPSLCPAPCQQQAAAYNILKAHEAQCKGKDNKSIGADDRSKYWDGFYDGYRSTQWDQQDEDSSWSMPWEDDDRETDQYHCSKAQKQGRRSLSPSYSRHAHSRRDVTSSKLRFLPDSRKSKRVQRCESGRDFVGGMRNRRQYSQPAPELRSLDYFHDDSGEKQPDQPQYTKPSAIRFTSGKSKLQSPQGAQWTAPSVEHQPMFRQAPGGIIQARVLSVEDTCSGHRPMQDSDTIVQGTVLGVEGAPSAHVPIPSHEVASKLPRQSVRTQFTLPSGTNVTPRENIFYDTGSYPLRNRPRAL